MANSEAQNVQRGIVFLWFINVLLMLIFVVVRFCKKEIDPIDPEDPRYAQNSKDIDIPKATE
jgi:hypothetical protein